MQQLLDVEERENELPILCLFGFSSLLHEVILKEFASKFRLIVVSDKRPDLLNEYPGVYFIPYSKVELIPKMAEAIRYAIVFLSEKSVLHLPHFVQKVDADKTRTLIISTIDDLEKNISTILPLKENPNFRFALLGEVLTRKKGEHKGDLSKIIENAILKHEVRVNGEDITPVYGITLPDAMIGIGRLLFGHFRSGTMHYLFYRHPETALETAHIIGRVETEITILFSEIKTASTLPLRKTLQEFVINRLRMQDSYMDDSFSGFETGLEILFKEKAEIEPVMKKAGKSSLIGRAGIPLEPLRFALFSLLAGGFFFLFLNLAFLGFGLLLLRGSIVSLQNNDFNSAAYQAKTSSYFLSAAKPTIELSLDLLGFLDREGRLQRTFTLVIRGRELVEIAGTTIYTLASVKQIDERSLTNALANLSYLYQEGQRVSLETNNELLSNQLKGTYSKLLSFSSVVPQVLGYKEEKNYLLLFQNDEELRPTGGFIGSIGDLTVKEGRVTKIVIQDVYELDGQLKNHIEPPFIVRRYLQPHLYLRDSNFYLNFQEAASTSAKIYNLETGKEPDAVIAIDLKVLKEIMKVTGPITLPSYNVTVDKDTVSQFIQSTIKDNFFPGSTQKRDILNSLFAQLVEKSKTDTKFNVELLKLLPDLLEHKDILVSFRDNSIQKVFSANGYGGEYSDPRPITAKAIKDFLYINEANIGVNKVNAAVSRSVKYNAIIGEGALMSKATLQLANNSPTDNYTTYITFAAPARSALKQIVINGVKQQIVPAVTDPVIYEAPDFQKPEGLETEQYQRDTYSFFAFTVVAKKGEKTTIDVEYENGAAKSLPSIIEYSLLHVKQPGTNPYDLTTTLNYPESYVPVKSKAKSYGKNFMENTMRVEKDTIYEETLQKKK